MPWSVDSPFDFHEDVENTRVSLKDGVLWGSRAKLSTLSQKIASAIVPNGLDNRFMLELEDFSIEEFRKIEKFSRLKCLTMKEVTRDLYTVACRLKIISLKHYVTKMIVLYGGKAALGSMASLFEEGGTLSEMFLDKLHAYITTDENSKDDENIGEITSDLSQSRISQQIMNQLHRRQENALITFQLVLQSASSNNLHLLPMDYYVI